MKAPHSKCGIRATVSGVRIPPSPPVLSCRTLSAAPGRARKPNNHGLRAQTSALRLDDCGPKFSHSVHFSPNLPTPEFWCRGSATCAMSKCIGRILRRFTKISGHRSGVRVSDCRSGISISSTVHVNAAGTPPNSLTMANFPPPLACHQVAGA